MKYLLILFCLLIPQLHRAQSLPLQDIPYFPSSLAGHDPQRHLLDVYPAQNANSKTPVAIFIHGGKWRLGSKDQYKFFGRKFAKNGITTIVISYRLTPQAQDYVPMAMDCAYAVKWVYDHIEEYGGDKNKIFLYGHSSGGHLSALIASNDRFFDSTGIANPVKGCVLLDAFGLNIDSYLQTINKKDEWMYTIFTKDQTAWKDACPVNFIEKESVRFLLYTGSNSPQRIRSDGEKFFDAATEFHKDAELVSLYNAGHLTIVFQLYYTKHRMYKRFIKFMNS